MTALKCYKQSGRALLGSVVPLRGQYFVDDEGLGKEGWDDERNDEAD